MIAVDNGNHSSDEPFDGNKRKLNNGFVMGILRLAKVPGTIKIKVSGAGLKATQKEQFSSIQ